VVVDVARIGNDACGAATGGAVDGEVGWLCGLGGAGEGGAPGEHGGDEGGGGEFGGGVGGGVGCVGDGGGGHC
jgi:hypothetical protein